MNRLQVVLITIGLLGAYVNYNPIDAPDPNPDIPDVPDPIEEIFPDAPTNLQVKSLADRLVTSSLSKDDALLAARTFRDWGRYLAKDKDIKNTGEFQKMFQFATQTYFSHYITPGTYPQINNLISDIITESLKGTNSDLTTGKENVALTPAIRSKYTQAMDAISWGCYNRFKGVK
jgi:hypothetical protein